MKESVESSHVQGSRPALEAALRLLGTGCVFTEQRERLAILWGDIEALIRTLELMKGQWLRCRAKTEAELKQECRTEDQRSLDKRPKSVLPHQTETAQRLLVLKKVREFALHGAVLRWGSGVAETDAVIHVDFRRPFSPRQASSHDPCGQSSRGKARP